MKIFSICPKIHLPMNVYWTGTQLDFYNDNSQKLTVCSKDEALFWHTVRPILHLFSIPLEYILVKISINNFCLHLLAKHISLSLVFSFVTLSYRWYLGRSWKMKMWEKKYMSVFCSVWQEISSNQCHNNTVTNIQPSKVSTK